MNDADHAEQPRPLRAALPWIVVAMLVLAAIIGVPLLNRQAQRDGVKHPAVGHALSQLELVPLTSPGRASGSPLELEDLRGKVSLINFWGPWCYPCRLEFPELMQLRQDLAEAEDFQFISVSSSAQLGEPLESLREETSSFLAEFQWELPTYADPTLETRKQLADVAETRGFSYPTTVLVGRDGTIQGLWIGYRKGVVEQMEAAVRKQLPSG